MSWQDIVFTFGQFIFVIALIPTIKGKDKPAFISSLITTIILIVFGTTYISLKLWGSAFMSFTTGTAWGILTVQKYLIDKKKNESG